MNAEAVADFVVENGLAVTFSHRIDKDDPDAGKKGTTGWQLKTPWPKGNRDGLLAQLHANHGRRNLLVITKPSNVLTIDCDTLVGVEKFVSMDPPETSFIRTGRDGGSYHLIYRPPAEGLQYTFFELSGDEETGPKVSGASSTKLHVLAGFHKTGREYELVVETTPPGNIATLPQELYDRLLKGYGKHGYRVRADIPAGKLVPASARHDYLVGQAEYYQALGHHGAILRAHLRVDWDLGCEPDPSRDIDGEIERIASWVESRVVA